MTDTDRFGVASLCEAFQRTVARCGDMIALRTPGGAQEISWREYGDRVRRIATGVAALGVGPGDTVGIMLLNRPEFALVDTAALHLGAVPLSVYNTSSPEQISYLFGNAGNKIVITEQLFLPAIAAAGTGVETFISIDGGAGTMALADLEDEAAGGFDFEASWRAVGPEDVLTLIYTSGTTGPPKGVELTHASMLAEIRGCHAVIPVRQGDRTVSYLPAAHVADRWYSHYTSVRRTRKRPRCPTARPPPWRGTPASSSRSRRRSKPRTHACRASSRSRSTASWRPTGCPVVTS